MREDDGRAERERRRRIPTLTRGNWFHAIGDNHSHTHCGAWRRGDSNADQKEMEGKKIV